MPIETFNKMRKSNCQICDGRGTVGIVIGDADYAKACTCVAGNDPANSSLLKYKPLHDKLKYSQDIELTEDETEIYNKMRRGKGDIPW